MEKQRTKEWFEKRKSRVTGSAVGAILGINPWMTKADVLRRMVRDYHGADSEFTGNAATAHGTFHEDNAAFDYTLETGNDIQETGFHTYEDWLGASPDGLIGDDGLIEIKCPYGLREAVEPNFKPLSEQPYYYAQIQIQLFVTGRKWCDFYQWNQHSSNLERVDIDNEWIDENLPRLKEFHLLHLSELDNTEHLKVKEVALDSYKDAQLAEQYCEAKAEMDKAKEALEAAKNALVERANGNKAKCFGLSIYPVERKGSIAYAKVVKEHCPDVDLEPYRGKGSVSWAIR